ncbi:hypothetical protein, partial [Enterobacter hormaechei]|uniref:hypothetical protein n=1 Tax=Enterobacter hormaechei TaxID=158836 RepID=UPI001A97955C
EFVKKKKAGENLFDLKCQEINIGARRGGEAFNGLLEARERGVLGGGGPASPEWLSLNAPLSMARALRAIAFNP